MDDSQKAAFVARMKRARASAKRSLQKPEPNSETIKSDNSDSTSPKKFRRTNRAVTQPSHSGPIIGPRFG